MLPLSRGKVSGRTQSRGSRTVSRYKRGRAIVRGPLSRQRKFQCDALSAVQDQLKPQHFLEKTLAGTYKTARSVSKLRTGDEALAAALTKNALRLERMGDVLENLHKTEEEVTRARAFADISPRQGASRVQDERQ